MTDALVKSEVVDRLAEKVAALLEPRLVAALEARVSTVETTALVDAATVADALGVDRSWVYAHADQLGAVKLGEGDKPRLRFDLERARAGVNAEPSKPKRHNGSRSASRLTTTSLLPIRGERA